MKLMLNMLVDPSMKDRLRAVKQSDFSGHKVIRIASLGFAWRKTEPGVALLLPTLARQVLAAQRDSVVTALLCTGRCQLLCVPCSPGKVQLHASYGAPRRAPADL